MPDSLEHNESLYPPLKTRCFYRWKTSNIFTHRYLCIIFTGSPMDESGRLFFYMMSIDKCMAAVRYKVLANNLLKK